MRTIHHSAIVVPANRQRQEFEPTAMEELKNSIELGRLLHAPVLRKDGEKLVLVVGERRLRAMKDIWALGGKIRYEDSVLPEGMVPYSLISELSVLEAEEAELDENLKRKDITWQEHALAVERLHKLRQAQAEQAATKDPISQVFGTAPALSLHTVADTAKELYGRSDGSYHDSVRTELLVAKHLTNPAVAKAKDAKEALKILKKQEAAERHEALAASVGKTFSSQDHTLLHGDFRSFLPLPEFAERFDVILTDPPYGMGADDFGDGGGKLTNSEHHYDDSYEAWVPLIKDFAVWSFSLAKPQAHCYAFCDFDRFHEFKAIMEAAGWYVFRTPLIVHKLNSGRVPIPDLGIRRQYELVLYAIKGKKPATTIAPDVIQSQADPNLTHGAQKPVAVMQNLLLRSVKPGDEVLDCFGGSGPTIEAGHAYKCKVTYVEKSAEYFGIALQRLKNIAAMETEALF